MRAAHDLTDDQLAELARMSVRASRAPDELKASVLAEIDAWLADPRTESELAADEHRLVDQADPEPLLDPVADLAGEGEQVLGGGASPVGEGQGVLGGEGDRASLP